MSQNPQTALLPKIPVRLQRVFAKHNISLVGIAKAESYPKVQKHYQQWIDSGHHGTMSYLERHSDLKTNPQKLLPHCQSLILVGFNYYQTFSATSKQNSEHGRIARYAWGRDYHKVIKNKLKKIISELQTIYPNESFYCNTDATPLLERHYAQKAGLGFIGKNTMNISLPYGSWFLIGEILTTKSWPKSKPASNTHGVCGSCTRCLAVCPTGALINPYKIDAKKCIAYLTIEHKGSIPVDLRPKIGNWLFGCDLCQEVCPHNIRAKVTTEPDFIKHISGSQQELKTILAIKTDAEFTDKFAGSPLMRAKREGLVRNACIVAGNLGNLELLPVLKNLKTDQNPVIAEHATWAVTQILASTTKAN